MIEIPSGTPEAVSGAEVLDRITGMFALYTKQQSEHHYAALALYCAYTHLSGVFRYAPRLVVTSAEKQSGKTRTLDILRELVAAPLVTANATVAALYRSIGADSEQPPTLVMDEADTVFGTRVKAEQNEDLRGLFNAGFQQGTPALRTVGPKHEVQAFDTFAPAVLAAIGTLPDTIVDRAVVIRLRRRRPGDEVEKYRLRQAEQLHALRALAAEWAATVRTRAAEYIPETDLEDRPADVWEPLLTVADLAGGHWPQTARAAAAYLVAEGAGAAAEVTEGVELLTDIRGVLRIVQSERIPSTTLLEHLRSLEASRWKEIDLTARRLSMILRNYSIRSKRTSSQHYYLRSELEAEIERYALPERDEGET